MRERRLLPVELVIRVQLENLKISHIYAPWSDKRDDRFQIDFAQHHVSLLNFTEPTRLVLSALALALYLPGIPNFILSEV